MSYIPPPTLPPGDPDRHLKCQDAVHVAFSDLARAAVEAGWDEQEVATALVEVADAHVLTVIENAGLDVALDQIKKRFRPE
ncbi:hypothetical protein PH552_12490 [Rhizobium sp. CNPSo 3968]|uniref:hypothetical protein n=1 Tax=Rhizobium sp. CNPSo 3968 TaxID=3021408 RepID=UPI002549FAA6|nr:hypothetical protein [Rhizobium sp. CNPSo 3968]MDK4720163.1 hypothetical protein [Rhizobium sp. CNPSo 3968]